MTGNEERAVSGGRPRSRRQVLAATAGAASLVGLAGCGGSSGDGSGATPTATSEYANYPVSGDTVTIGVSVPETGEHSQEGEQLRAGYKLAAQHINEGAGVAGMGAFDSLSGGLKGKEVELAVENTDSSGSGAEEAAASLVESEGVNALVGGASGAEASAMNGVATDEQIVYMTGFAPSNAVTGSDCSEYGFQEMFNAEMAARALRPVLVDEFGEKANIAQVRPNSAVGKDFAAAMRNQLTNVADWFPLTTEPTKVGTQSFKGPIQAALDRDPKVLVLNYYGLAGALALKQAQEVVPDEVGVVAPLMDRPMAANANAALEGVIGTVAWDFTIDTDLSAAFRDGWKDADFTQEQSTLSEPSGLGHLAYVQLLQYAAAVERAGSFEPPAVISELEGFSYDTGLGEETMRTCDHQAQRPVPVVRGRAKGEQAYSRYFELLEVRREDVGYPCSEAPAADCSF
ncbi:ABC transporter substrate-binding protein [Halobacteriales archaeon Cl-PHB]